MEEDWDTLIILDACRFDDFKQQCSLVGELESRISLGADSLEFMEKNFAGKKLHDTVCVTGNPYIHWIGDNVFHEVIDDPLSNWNSELECVTPDVVSEAAIEAHKMYENKRIIVHYMQPHDPPIGEKGAKLKDKYELGGVTDINNSDRKRLFEAVAEGEIGVEEAREAYRETLDIVLEEVEELLTEIEGKIVVTADHGEMFGEQPYPILGRLFEHYRHPHTQELCKVPWLVIDDCHRNITSASPVGNSATASADLDEQLEALGYK